MSKKKIGIIASKDDQSRLDNHRVLEKEMITELIEIKTTLKDISAKLSLITSQLSNIISPNDSTKQSMLSELHEKEVYPLELFNLPEPLRQTLVILAEVYQQKKRPIAVKEIQDRIPQLGYHTILGYLKQLQYYDDRSWVKKPITRRYLNKIIKDIEKEGNPENVDLSLPETSGRAFFWEPVPSILEFIIKMKS